MLIQILIGKQKMMENRHLPSYQQEAPSFSRCFGKPTKLRSEEPSMFEILSWNSGTMELKENHPNENLCCGCNCHKTCQEGCLEHQAHYNIYNQGQGPANSSKKISFDEKASRKNIPINSSKLLKDQVLEGQRIKKEEPRQHKSVRQSSKQPQPKQTKLRPSTANNASKSPPRHEKPNKKEFQQTDEDITQKQVNEQEKLIKKFKETTRWIPNSAFTTYFGKPAFQNYGRGNTNPTSGGLMYGDYLKSHNVQPHRGMNSPKNIQSYTVALMKGEELGPVYPFPPKVNKRDLELSKTDQVPKSPKSESSPIYAMNNNSVSLPIYPPNLNELEKFKGKGIHKVNRSRFQKSWKGGKENEDNMEQEYVQNSKYQQRSGEW